MKTIPSDILKTAAALMAMTEERGCTPEEAATAASKLIALADRHGVTLDDLQNNLDEAINTIIRKEVSLGLGGRVNGRRGAIQLATAMADGFECSLVAMNRPCGLNEKVCFVGFEADALCSAYAYSIIITRLVIGAIKKGCSKSLTSFLVGASFSIHKRLSDKRIECRASSETGLVLRDKKADLIADELSETKKAGNSKLKLNPQAVLMGVEAGASIALPVASQKSIEDGRA